MGHVPLNIWVFGYVAGTRRLIAPWLENPMSVPFSRGSSRARETEVGRPANCEAESVFGYLFAPAVSLSPGAHSLFGELYRETWRRFLRRPDPYVVLVFLAR